MYYFTSDTHFCHTGIITKSRTQFSSIDDMNRLILNNINAKLSRKDTLYIVGDMFFGSSAPVKEIMAEIKPKIILIKGNHDKDWLKKLSSDEKDLLFSGIHDTLGLKKYGYEIHLSHYPLLAWNRSHYFGTSFSICGHIHGRRDSTAAAQLFPLVKCQFNCGVDINNFEPVNFEELVRNNAEFYGTEYTREESEKMNKAIEALMKN